MKRLLKIGLVLIVLFTLSGCKATKGFSTLAHEYLVSAVGFEEEKGEIQVFLETVVVNSEDTEAQKKNELLEGNGKTVKAAVKGAAEKAAESVELSHCAVAVIGESVSGDTLKEICDFLKQEDSISLAVTLVNCENAKELLSSETISSVAVGYDIMSMQQTNSRISGINYKNRFYEIEQKRNEAAGTFSLPHFILENGKYYIDGMTVYKENTAVMRLDSTSSSIYAIATNEQNRGVITLEGDPLNIEYANTSLKLKGNNAPEIFLVTRLSAEGGKQTKALIEDKINELFTASQRLNVDIFGVGNTIEQKNNAFYSKIKKKYYNFYKNMKLEVRVK